MAKNIKQAATKEKKATIDITKKEPIHKIKTLESKEVKATKQEIKLTQAMHRKERERNI